MGEFDRIAAQVDQHLLQAHGITHHGVGQRGVYVKQHLYLLGPHIGRQDDGQVPQQAVQAKRLGVQHHLLGIDLGEIQHIVEQAQ